jgi:homoserine O-acetyltransferase
MSDTFEQQSDGSTRFVRDQAFSLENGQSLSQLTLVYETWGDLNSDKSNAVLVHHALSVGSHARMQDENDTFGWWQKIIGPGKAIDTDTFFVICINNLGSCYGSSGPLSHNPATNQPYRGDFPQVTIGDMTASQKLLADELGIEKFHAVLGGSMGAMLSLEWGISYPDSVANLILISSSYKAYPANIANRSIQNQAIRMDPLWQGGNYENNEMLTGFKLARKLGLYTYRNSTEWNGRFNSHGNGSVSDMDIIEYMDYNADKFCAQFDANSYLILTQAMDLFDVTQKHGSIEQCFSKIKAKTLVVSVNSDILFTPQQQEELHDALLIGGVDCHYINHPSTYGHDAFLVEKDPFTKYIGEFLIPSEY